MLYTLYCIKYKILLHPPTSEEPATSTSSALALTPIPEPGPEPVGQHSRYARQAFVEMMWDVQPSPGVPAFLYNSPFTLSISYFARRRFTESCPTFTSFDAAVEWLYQQRARYMVYTPRNHPMFANASLLSSAYLPPCCTDGAPIECPKVDSYDSYPDFVYARFFANLRHLAQRPHARALMLRGGLASRILDWCGGLDAAALTFDYGRLSTPSIDLIVHGYGCSHPSNLARDDTFDPAELHLLCGSVRFIELPKADPLFFFPPLDVFENSSQWQGTWTAANEAWFRN
ncbi:hypothetical protein SISSUDRAFT_1068237 [Sistotremastrum suecicum HHB10207 ss-3]|uniref:Uncharacterized protein n=1 Tax=Sistotremastrum suecicum HHB10207 ss-3 TaxID=1314776 RepID=A0A165WDA6_9AGAM|nr:hypothetical protein SISSUDRAFT_1068237 [Sistotremastrum suecicum HHB10207 ss-3]